MGLSSAQLGMTLNAFDDWESAGHGEKNAILEVWSQTIGITPRRLRERFVNMNLIDKKSRSLVKPAGQYMGQIKWTEVVAGYQITDPFNTVRTKDAVECAVRHGDLPDDALQVPERTWNKWLTKYGFRATKSRVRCLMAERPNEVWVFDCSRSNHFNVEGSSKEPGDFILRWQPKKIGPYKNKDEKKARLRVWICLFVDHHSGYVLGRYYVHTGESWRIGLPFFDYAMSRADRSKVRMAGRPERIYADQGAIMKKKEIVDGLTRIGCEIDLHSPGNSQAGGKVERQFRNLWKCFEAPFSIASMAAKQAGEKYFTINLAELNEQLENYLQKYNAEAKHPYLKGETRESAWMKILHQGGVVEIESGALSKGAKTYKRQVGPDGGVSCQGKKYEVVGLENAVGELFLDTLGNPTFVCKGYTYPVRLKTPDPYGKFKGNRKLPHDRLDPQFTEKHLEPFHTGLNGQSNVIPMQRIKETVDAQPYGVDRGNYSSEAEAVRDFIDLLGGEVWNYISVTEKNSVTKLLQKVIKSTRSEVEDFAYRLKESYKKQRGAL